MLPKPVLVSPDTFIADALSAWRAAGGSAEPPPDLARNQRAWDEPVCETAVTAAERRHPDQSPTTRFSFVGLRALVTCVSFLLVRPSLV